MALAASAVQRQAGDPDIQATSETISFKDPLAYIPLRIPIRGLHCLHIQSFDAQIFLGMMEQTPTWLCPTCNRTINPDDLVLDGYTKDLMDSVPKSVDTVIVETDGTWRSEDNKYGNSAKAVEARAAKAAAKAAAAAGGAGGGTDESGRGASAAISVGTGGMSSKAGTPFDVKPDVSSLTVPNASTGAGAGAAGNETRRHGKGRGPSEVIDLDDGDDDDERTPPRIWASAAAAAAPARSQASRGGGGGVIDLTLSDDDDDDNDAIVRRSGAGTGGVASTAASKRRIDSDWEDGPTPPPSQRARFG